MTNIPNKLERDYISAGGYFKQKTVGEAVKIVDKMLILLIHDWNTSRRLTTAEEDNEMLEEIDALRDVLYYLTQENVYNNDLQIRNKYLNGFFEYLEFGLISEEELLEKKEAKLEMVKKLHKKNGVITSVVTPENLHCYSFNEKKYEEYLEYKKEFQEKLDSCEKLYGKEVKNVMSKYEFESGEQANNFIQLEKLYGWEVANRMVKDNLNCKKAQAAIKSDELERKQFIKKQAINFVENLSEEKRQEKYEEYIIKCKNKRKYDKYSKSVIEVKEEILVDLMTDVKHDQIWSGNEV